MQWLLYRDYFYELRIDLEDWEGNTTYAKYKIFLIGDYTENYELTAMVYSGTAGSKCFSLICVDKLTFKKISEYNGNIKNLIPLLRREDNLQ